ncbi:response regulator transcription factor [Lacticigenium naphthae]|uniref:response regulator transcription factor n=1 Tax=Lacticigenium naphthae TaxID=515351 RepID=UPI00041ECE78|nr:response regulator transcription factor [Lacticigenium naphthae]
MKKVLIVDDEQSILTLLSFNLKKEGYAVDTALDGQEGYQLAKKNQYDFIILDLMLPTMDGMEICKSLRQDKIETPILMLTAKDSEIDKIIGLEIGADDYMTKPFSPREVFARMKAILRRSKNNSPSDESKPEEAEDQQEEIRVGDIVIYPTQYEVIVRGDKIEFTPKEFELLVYLVKRKNRILSREQLLNAIWDIDFAGETRIVDVHISHLREKIEENTKTPLYIKTARGFGYKFEVPKE